MITVIRLRTYSCHSSSDQLRNYGAPADLQCTVSEIQTHCLKVFLSARDSGLFCNFLLFFEKHSTFPLSPLRIYINILYQSNLTVQRLFTLFSARGAKFEVTLLHLTTLLLLIGIDNPY